MLSLSLAHAHGPAEWIQRGGYKNALGELCCGERDCFELADADVKITPAGYFVIGTKRDDPVQRGDALADRNLLALRLGRQAQVLLRATGQHLTDGLRVAR